MTPTRFRECLALLRWSQRGLADILRRDEGTVRMMARGKRDIPAELAEWLERAAAWFTANPVPIEQDGRALRIVGLNRTVRADTTAEDWQRSSDRVLPGDV